MPQASCPPAERIAPLEMSPACTAIGATASSARFPVEYDGAATTEPRGKGEKITCPLRWTAVHMPSSATPKAMTPSRPPRIAESPSPTCSEFIPAKAGTRLVARDFSNSHRGGINMPTPDPREALRAVEPKLMDVTDKVLFADVWARPALS